LLRRASDEESELIALFGLFEGFESNLHDSF
jgi:hypothetical protein